MLAFRIYFSSSSTFFPTCLHSLLLLLIASFFLIILFNPSFNHSFTPFLPSILIALSFLSSLLPTFHPLSFNPKFLPFFSLYCLSPSFHTDLSTPMWNSYAYKESTLGWTGLYYNITYILLTFSTLHLPKSFWIYNMGQKCIVFKILPFCQKKFLDTLYIQSNTNIDTSSLVRLVLGKAPGK